MANITIKYKEEKCFLNQKIDTYPYFVIIINEIYESEFHIPISLNNPKRWKKLNKYINGNGGHIFKPNEDVDNFLIYRGDNVIQLEVSEYFNIQLPINDNIKKLFQDLEKKSRRLINEIEFNFL